MELRQLGKTGMKVTPLGYGTWQTFGETVDEEQAVEIMKAVWDSGIRFFDGAEAYAAGKADDLMGKVLARMKWPREDYILTGKCINGGEGPWHRGISRKRLVTCCEKTLKRYQTDYLDLFFCHRPDGVTPPEEVVITMNALIQQGKILYWATSEFDPITLERMWQFADKHGLAGPVAEQTGYNMIGRDRIEKALPPLFEKWGMGSTVYSPIAAGLLSGKYNDGIPEGTRYAEHDWLRNRLNPALMAKLKELQEIAEGLGVSMASMALGWVLKNENVSVAIMGARKPEQVTRNMESLEAMDKLTPEVLERIEEALKDKE